jgi:sec-independent protein translocase protein TatA
MRVTPNGGEAAMPFNIGPFEIIVVLIIVLVIFGPKRLPGLGRSLGSGLREFKDSVSSRDSGSSRAEVSASAEETPAEPAPERTRGTAATEPAEPVGGGAGSATARDSAS